MTDRTTSPGDNRTPPTSHAAEVADASKLDRRTLLISSAVAGAGLLGFAVARHALGNRAPVFLAAGQKYDGSLVSTIRDGLLACGLQLESLRGRRVLLKPNMVEPRREARHMTTHPAVVRSVAEVFRGWEASVTVGEAPGHVRDTEMALVESGLGEALDDDRLPFADLNYEDVRWVPNRGRKSKLPGFHFPHSVIEADLIVSLPKLKTHHWVGVTAAMKNLYGTLPGVKYGWPKNVLHYAGIPETVVDINASLPKAIAVVDGIECMEGDGPIMGTPKQLGLIAISLAPAAVDATCARIIGIEPRRVRYLDLASTIGGVIDPRRIEQRGDDWRPLVTPFEVLDVPHLRGLRTDPSRDLI
jgi:uncharacterized protein (DUF362 family)